jgi:hypothetical protein
MVKKYFKKANMKSNQKTTTLKLGKKAISNLSDKEKQKIIAGKEQITSFFLCFSHKCSEPCGGVSNFDCDPTNTSCGICMPF